MTAHPTSAADTRRWTPIWTCGPNSESAFIGVHPRLYFVHFSSGYRLSTSAFTFSADTSLSRCSLTRFIASSSLCSSDFFLGLGRLLSGACSLPPRPALCPACHFGQLVA